MKGKSYEKPHGNLLFTTQHSSRGAAEHMCNGRNGLNTGVKRESENGGEGIGERDR